MGLYQDHKGSVCSPMGIRSAHGGLHRRYTGISRVQANVGRSGLRAGLPLGMSRFLGQQEEIPTQSIEFLGIVVHTLAMDVKLPGEKLKKIRAEAGRLLREE